jgi:Myb/SANT-like DNA-binding protein
MEEKLLDGLIEAQRIGLQTDNSQFKKAGWDKALEAVGSVTSQPITIQQLKSKFDTFKQDWKAWEHFATQSGHGFDWEKGVPTADDAYFEAHPRARKFRSKPIAHKEQLQGLLHGALATGEDVVELDVLMLDEERGNGDDEEEDEHGRLLGEPRDENNNNDDNNLNSDSTQPYDWPDDSQLPVIDALPTVIDLLESSQLPNQPHPSQRAPRQPAPSQPSQPTPSQQAPSQPRQSAISLRKRSSRNATEADRRKRKKSSGHALADALGEATSEIKASRQLLIDMGLTSTAKAAKILVSEFGNVSGRDQDLLYAAIGTEGQADLFIARSPEQRRDWVHRTLLVAKGLPADDDQSAAVGHGADVDLTAGPNVGELGSTTEEDDDLENFRGL